MSEVHIIRHPLAEIPEDLPNTIPSVLKRIYAQRGVTSAQELEHNLKNLLPPSSLGGVKEASQYLIQAMRANKNILIVGDFDADGATSSALAVLALKKMGHAKVEYLVPNRFEFGYGLTPEIVALAKARNAALIVTVDNGISSISGVNAANEAGIPVIVTDHHLAAEHLPNALAIVNPNAPGNEFESKVAAGVGVIFYTMLALRAALREDGWFTEKGIAEPNLAELLDLVALGTVADVVPLDSNNRIMVAQGLARIRAGKCRPGITAILQVAGRNPALAQANDMGFAVGPRLNAAGRLDDMSLGIECLLADSYEDALKIAHDLDALNRERRQIEDGMKQEAEKMLDSWSPEDTPTELPWGLCLYKEDWHQGVIGILASRIKEKFHRPVIAFAPGDPGFVKGSARSIPGFHIRDALDEIAAKSPKLLSKFGGHAMAAGMTIAEEDFVEFSQRFDEVARKYLDESDLSLTLYSDGEVPAAEMNLDTAQALVHGGPWGQGFIEPMFDGEFFVLNSRVVGEKHWKLVLQQADGKQSVDAISFNSVEDWPQVPGQIRAAYRLDVNEWRGQCSLQLRLEYFERA